LFRFENNIKIHLDSKIRLVRGRFPNAFPVAVEINAYPPVVTWACRTPESHLLARVAFQSIDCALWDTCQKPFTLDSLFAVLNAGIFAEYNHRIKKGLTAVRPLTLWLYVADNETREKPPNAHS